MVSQISDDKMKRNCVRDIISAIGDDPTRQGLLDTPDRVVRMWKELFRGYDERSMPKITVFDNGEDGIIYDEMIHDNGTFFSHCEHHMLPFFGKYWFAYIPSKNGKILGLSKVARVVDYFSAKLQVQERLTHEIIAYLWDYLCDSAVCKQPAIGMALCMEAEHLCKTMRGAKKVGKMRTTYLIGAFKQDTATRAEFMDWINHK